MFRIRESFGAAPAQLALRVAILGGLAAVLFCVLLFRLWFLQVLSGERFLAKANDNRVRDVRIEAPRGEIVDRNGTVLVDNRTALGVHVDPQEFPKGAAGDAEFARLAKVMGTRRAVLERRYKRQLRQLPFSTVTLDTGVRTDAAYYLRENQGNFPGVSVDRVFLRSYPRGTVGAHLFGSVGQVTKDQLGQGRYQDVPTGSVVGQSGLEYEYDRYLRGEDGAIRQQVDALGRPKGQPLKTKQPKVGNRLRLSIDLGLQRAAEQAVRAGIGLGGGGLGGGAGAAVAMDVRTGQVLALASAPGYDPNVFSKPIGAKRYKALFGERAGAPLTNRAISGLYPTGSTFKPITALAALSSHMITPETTIVDTGKITVAGLDFKNAGGAVNGALQLGRALTVSSDVFFYTLGLRSYFHHRMLLARWARRLGLGRPTGVDLPNEATGLIPTPAWRRQHFKDSPAPVDREWRVGDSINLSVGQGDLQADPLQLALAYAAIGNGGYILKPHIGEQIEDAQGRVLQDIKPPSRRKVKIDPGYRQTILDGLKGATSQPGGTAESVFAGFGVSVAGKTGTAERPPHGDQAWFAALAPADNPQIVVVTTIENGGFGADSAAPAAKLILAHYFDQPVGQLTGGGRSD